MEDHVLIEHRLQVLEVDVKEVTKTVDERDDKCVAHSDRLHAIERWKDGNGARGSEARLQKVEEAVDELKRVNDEPRGVTQEQAEAIGGAAAVAIVTNAKKRDKTARLKAWGVYFAAACLLAGNIIQAVL